MRLRKTSIGPSHSWQSFAGSRSCASASGVRSRGAPERSCTSTRTPGDFYVDVRLDGAFRRARVTGDEEQADVLSRVRRALADEGDS
jgi:hypothetical protein